MLQKLTLANNKINLYINLFKTKLTEISIKSLQTILLYTTMQNILANIFSLTSLKVVIYPPVISQTTLHAVS